MLDHRVVHLTRIRDFHENLNPDLTSVNVLTMMLTHPGGTPFIMARTDGTIRWKSMTITMNAGDAAAAVGDEAGEKVIRAARVVRREAIKQIEEAKKVAETVRKISERLAWDRIEYRSGNLMQRSVDQ